MKRSPFQRRFLPPALTTFGGAWGPDVTPCRCLSCLLAPTRERDEAIEDRETEREKELQKG